MIASMLCWGSWANTFKLTRKWRFELFYFDYAIGVFLLSIVAGLTFGSMGDDFSFWDNVTTAGKRIMLFAFLGGCVFNLANMLLVAAISLAGLAVAFPIGIGIALIEGVVLNFLLNPQGNRLFLIAGVGLVLLAIVTDALAYFEHGKSSQTTTPFSWKGILISVVSGILMGLFYPLVEISKLGENGLQPYGVAFIFALGVLISTGVFNLYFINLPVHGQPIPLKWYVRPNNMRNHFLGVFGGMVWCAGALCNFLAASAPRAVNVGPAVSYALGQGATMISVLWGLLVWKEFRGATGKVSAILAVMLLLFVGGLTLIALAPLN